MRAPHWHVSLRADFTALVLFGTYCLNLLFGIMNRRVLLYEPSFGTGMNLSAVCICCYC